MVRRGSVKWSRRFRGGKCPYYPPQAALRNWLSRRRGERVKKQ